MDSISFKKNRFELFFIRYSTISGFIVTIALLEGKWIYRGDSQDFTIIFWLGLLFLFLHACVYLLSVIFIYRVDFYPKERKILLHMFRKNRSYNINYSGLDKIHVNLYVTFYFNGKKRFYRGVEEEALIEFLKKYEKVTWGKYWKVLTPQ